MLFRGRPVAVVGEQVTTLGASIADGAFPGLDEIPAGEIQQKYERDAQG